MDTLVCPKSTSGIRFSNINSSKYSIFLNGNASRDSNYSFQIGQDTTVHFLLFDSLQSNCGTAPVDVNIKTIKFPPLSISADQSVYCGGNLPATVTGSGNFEEYDVYYNDSLVQSDVTNTYTKTGFKSGDRVVMKAKFQGCVTDSSNAVVLLQYDAPVADFNYKNGGKGLFTFINKSDFDKKRTWYFGDGSSDTSANPSHTYTTNKIYTVWLVISGDGGCMDSISKTITTTGIRTSLIDQESLLLMPNPCKNSINLTFFSKTEGQLKLSLSNVNGELIKLPGILKMTEGNNAIVIPLEDVAPGIYYLVINDGRQAIARKIMITP